MEGEGKRKDKVKDTKRNNQREGEKRRVQNKEERTIM